MDTQVEHSSRVGRTGRERASSRLLAHIERRTSLEGRTISRMYDLYATYYDATSPSRFEKDLDDKDWVVVLRDEAGMLAGFSSLAIVDASVDGRCLRAIYSGDTIIGRTHWGTQAPVSVDDVRGSQHLLGCDCWLSARIFHSAQASQGGVGWFRRCTWPATVDEVGHYSFAVEL